MQNVAVITVAAGITIYAVLTAGLWWVPGPTGDHPAVSSVISGKSEFRSRVDRIAEIRSSGAKNDGLHTIMQPVKITNDDYFLMACDNSSANRNFPDVPNEQREEGRWFSGSPSLTGHFPNSHGLVRKDGSIEIESFYATIPRPQYQASPEEVAWHCTRVMELRAQQMPVEQRVATMTSEAKGAPWRQMK